MRVLLDTHCWLWSTASPQRLNDRARAVFEDPANELLLSAASAWEIAIKFALKKLKLPLSPAEYVPTRMRDQSITALPVQHAHALEVASLPKHHRDPFDRLLIAQARLETLPLLTADPAFGDYDVTLIWAGPQAEDPASKRKRQRSP